uniref:Telomeric single stranded DNA binding POT1/Cdc13 domain-containing protein n=1 Tax=Loa loa TaxID=7209 RepID=A0A1I7VVE6_LOALO
MFRNLRYGQVDKFLNVYARCSVIVLASFVNVKNGLSSHNELEFVKKRKHHRIHVFAKVAEVRNIRSVDILENVQIVSVIYLRDSSAGPFIRCTVYSELTDTFPQRIKTDQIIQLNHIHIRTNRGRPPSLYGKLNVAGFAVALITYQPFNIIFHSSANYSVSENCQKMVFLGLLVQGYSSDMPVVSPVANSIFGNTLGFNNENKTVCRLDQLIRFQYHNIVVQAVSIFISDRGNIRNHPDI